MKEKIKLHKYSIVLLIFILVKLAISIFDISLSQTSLKSLGTEINTLLISGFFIIYLIETLETRANKLRYLKPAKQLTSSVNQEELKKCLVNEDIKSIMINGKAGSGKTTLVESSIETKFILKLNPFTDNVADNYLDYLFSEVCFNNLYTYIPIIVVWLVVLIIQLSSLKTNSVLMLVIGVVITVLIKNFKMSRKLKQRLIISELKTLDLIIIDDLDQSLKISNESLKLIHFIHSSITENQKLIIIADLTSDLEITNNLNKYFDYRLDLDNSIIKHTLINSLDLDDEQVKNLMLEVELSDLEKIKCHYQTQNISQKNYLNDQVFKLILMYHHQLDQREITKLVSGYDQSEVIEMTTKLNQELKNKITENQFKYICELIEDKNEERLNVYLNN